MRLSFKANNWQHFQNEVSSLAARLNSKPHIVTVVIEDIEEEITMNTWFLCFQQTGSNRYASVTSDPSLLDDVVLNLEFQHHARDWTWFDTVRLHHLLIKDTERNPDGCMVEDWETGRCEVVDGVLVVTPDFPEDDEDASPAGRNRTGWRLFALERRSGDHQTDGEPGNIRVLLT